MIEPMVLIFSFLVIALAACLLHQYVRHQHRLQQRLRNEVSLYRQALSKALLKTHQAELEFARIILADVARRHDKVLTPQEYEHLHRVIGDCLHDDVEAWIVGVLNNVPTSRPDAPRPKEPNFTETSKHERSRL